MATTMEGNNPLIPMERTTNIIRRSIHTYLKHYQYFTFTASLLVFPVSVALLLSQAFVPFSSPLLPTIYTRLQTIFYAAGFPSSSQFFSILTLKLSQTICSSIFILPLSLSLLLVTKAAIIQALHHHQNQSFPPSSFFSLYIHILHTYLCNSFVIITANAVALTLLFLVFNSLEAFNFSSPNSLLYLSAAGAVVYSVILANALVVCNLALIVAGMENSGGYLAILKACVLIRGRTSTALLLALPFNLGLAAVEALFQYRVVRIHLLSDDNNVNCYSMASEGLLIAYLYSILIVLDTITTCIFYKSCKLNSQIDQDDDKYYCLVQLVQDEDHCILKTFEELP